MITNLSSLEVEVRICLLCASSQNAIQFETWELIDVNVGSRSLLSHSYVLLAWVNLERNTKFNYSGLKMAVIEIEKSAYRKSTNTPSTGTADVFLFFRGDVDDLNDISSHKDDVLFVNDVQVGSLLAVVPK